MSGSFDKIRGHLSGSAAVKENIATTPDLLRRIHDAGALMTECVRNGGKILWCGNGGSAADSQHLSAELAARLNLDRPGIPSIALTVDTSLITAWSNDKSFNTLFSRQIETLGKTGDVLIAISTSGNSENVLNAVRAAGRLQMTSIALLGKDGGSIRSESDLAIVVPSENTQHIQESHITIGHILCDMIESGLFGGS